MHHLEIKKEQNIDIIELSNQNINLKIANQLGFNLFSLIFNGQETIYFNDNFKDYATNKKLAGIPFMHPWANRLNGDKIFNQSLAINTRQEELIYRDSNKLPLHGLILKSNKWEITATKTTAHETTCTAKYSFDDDDLLNIFPFKHDISLTIKLQENKVYYIVEIFNKSDKPMPICFGFHPYFSIGKYSQNTLQVPDASIAEINEKLIPTQNYTDKNKLFPFKNNSLNIKNQHIDHAFVHHNQNDKYKLTTKKYQIEFNLDKNYKIVQIYHPNKGEEAYICIEPMTALANALNNENYSSIPARKKSKAIFSMKFI